MGTAGFCALTHQDDFALILLFLLPLIWFISLIDSLSIIDKADDGREISGLPIANRKIISVAFSIVPGAGHMYLGLMKQGLQLMTLFFFTAFLMGWLNLSLLVFILPIIWFYSLFDAYHQIESKNYAQDNNLELPFKDWIETHPYWTIEAHNIENNWTINKSSRTQLIVDDSNNLVIHADVYDPLNNESNVDWTVTDTNSNSGKSAVQYQVGTGKYHMYLLDTDDISLNHIKG